MYTSGNDNKINKKLMVYKVKFLILIDLLIIG